VSELPTRQRLSAAAARLFAERGYHGASVRDLAAAVGIDKSSVYAHVAGKEDLLAEIALSGAAAFHGALDALPEEPSPRERIRLALRAHLRVVERQLDVATIWLREWRYLSDPAREQFIGERRRYEQRISELFEAAVAAGEARADLDVRYATLLFLSAANWAYTWLTHETSVDDVVDGFWLLLSEGISH
jgi:TetR/AcrR family transcriptional regulator, cholesterol catabolism regulator